MKDNYFIKQVKNQELGNISYKQEWFKKSKVFQYSKKKSKDGIISTSNNDSWKMISHKMLKESKLENYFIELWLIHET